MAKNQVTLTLAGDSKSLERAFDRAGTDAKGMADDFELAGKRSRRAADGIDNMGERAGNTEGKFSGLADVMDGLNTTFGLGLERQIEYARAGGDVMGGLEQLKGVASGAVKGIGKVADKFSDAAKAAVVAKVQTVKTAAVQSAAWIKTSAQAMASAIKVRAAWIISMGPIALVIAAVAGAVFLIVKYWDEIKGAAEATWTWVRDKFAALKDFLIEWAPLLAGPMGLVIKYWDEIKGAATAVFTWVTGKFNDLVEFLSHIPGRIGRNLTGPFEGIKEGAVTAKTWVTERFEDVVTFLEKIPGRIGRVLTGPFEGIKEAATTAWTWVTGRFEAIVTAAGTIGSRVAGVVTGAFDSIGNALKTAWNFIAGKLNAIKIPGFTIGVGPFKKTFGAIDPIPHVGTFHTGGVVPGPRGSPSAIMALGGERILSPAASAGTTYSITVNALDPRAAGAAVVEAIAEYERRNGQRFARA